jgi:hypothetical protein
MKNAFLIGVDLRPNLSVTGIAAERSCLDCRGGRPGLVFFGALRRSFNAVFS